MQSSCFSFARPDTTQEMILTTNASHTSISFNLSQIMDGKETIIEFGTRGLRQAEKNYSVYEKELLTVITGVYHYRDYLGNGKEFLIITDNIDLKYLNTMKHATGRLGRWSLLLGEYKYRVEHTRGQDNILADRLSRSLRSYLSLTWLMVRRGCFAG